MIPINVPTVMLFLLRREIGAQVLQIGDDGLHLGLALQLRLGLVNLVVGNAGAVLTANLEPEMPSWFQVAKLVHGYTKFEVTRKRISLKSIDVDGNVIDEWSKSSP